MTVSDFILGNVFWPCPQTYDSTISRLLARLENSTMKVLSHNFSPKSVEAYELMPVLQFPV